MDDIAASGEYATSVDCTRMLGFRLTLELSVGDPSVGVPAVELFAVATRSFIGPTMGEETVEPFVDLDFFGFFFLSATATTTGTLESTGGEVGNGASVCGVTIGVDDGDFNGIRNVGVVAVGADDSAGGAGVACRLVGVCVPIGDDDTECLFGVVGVDRCAAGVCSPVVVPPPTTLRR